MLKENDNENTMSTKNTAIMIIKLRLQTKKNAFIFNKNIYFATYPNFFFYKWLTFNANMIAIF